MSDTPTTTTPVEPKRLGLLAKFATPDDMVHAAEKITDSGYSRVEAFTPFPVLGIDDALKAKGTILPWIVFCMGCIGCTIAILMQWYTNGTEWGNWLSGYQFTISGKPYFSLPANIPVTFELIVLLSAFGAFFGMLMLNKLPRLSNPLFSSEEFASATTDGFFLFIDSDDAKYAEAETEAYLKSVGAEVVEPIEEVVEGTQVPGFIYTIGIVSACIAMLPPLWIWSGTNAPTTIPRISFFKDMESQAKFKAQSTTDLFADGRAMRTAVPYTIARGGLKENIQLHYGVNDLESLTGASMASILPESDTPFRLISDSEETDSERASEEGAGPAAEQEINADWVTEFPIDVTDEAMQHGRERFDIYCATCHGMGGDGDGLVTKRAMDLAQGTWTQPTSLHAEAVTSQPIGKLYHTVTNGVRMMPGYRAQISVEDRWAIVLYLQALQRSRAATEADVPAEMLKTLSNQN